MNTASGLCGTMSFPNFLKKYNDKILYLGLCKNSTKKKKGNGVHRSKVAIFYQN